MDRTPGGLGTGHLASGSPNPPRRPHLSRPHHDALRPSCTTACVQQPEARAPKAEPQPTSSSGGAAAGRRAHGPGLSGHDGLREGPPLQPGPEPRRPLPSRGPPSVGLRHPRRQLRAAAAGSRPRLTRSQLPGSRSAASAAGSEPGARRLPPARPPTGNVALPRGRGCPGAGPGRGGRPTPRPLLPARPPSRLTARFPGPMSGGAVTAGPFPARNGNCTGRYRPRDTPTLQARPLASPCPAPDWGAEPPETGQSWGVRLPHSRPTVWGPALPNPANAPSGKESGATEGPSTT